MATAYLNLVAYFHGKIDELRAENAALTRHVERYEAALRHYEAQWVIGPFRERVDIGGVAREALKEEP